MSNFYFEYAQADDGIVDKVTGEIIIGLRQYGVSKEHRPNPIVEMGLFMDSRGIPISMGGRAFIVTQSIRKLGNTLKKAVFNDYDYKLLSDDAPVTIEEMKNFDRHNPDNLALYKDSAYKVITTDKCSIWDFTRMWF